MCQHTPQEVPQPKVEPCTQADCNLPQASSKVLLDPAWRLSLALAEVHEIIGFTRTTEEKDDPSSALSGTAGQKKIRHAVVRVLKRGHCLIKAARTESGVAT